MIHVITEELWERARKIGYEEMSRRTGIPRTHFYRIFSTDGNPSLDTIVKIAWAVGYKLKLAKDAGETKCET